MKHSITRHTVPRETFEATDSIIKAHNNSFETYINQLLWWNERVNLVSRNVSRETIWAHIRHSLLLSQFPPYQETNFIVDAGTGGGLPGLPLAIASCDKTFLLNDIVSKKILAVKQIAQNLSLENVTTQTGSVEMLKPGEPFTLVSKHAFKIDDLFRMVQHQNWMSLIFYKGIYFEKELEGLPSPIQIDVHELDENGGTNFYKDKAIVILKHKHDH